MKSGILIIFSLFMYFGGLNLAFCSENAPLSDREIKKFITDWPRFFSWYKKNQEGFWEEVEKKGNVEIHMVKNGAFLFKGIENLSEVSAFLDKKGWHSKRFFYVMNRASDGLAYLDMKESAPENMKSMQKALESLRNNRQIPEAERREEIAELKDDILDLEQDLESHRMPDEELAIVVSHKTALEKIFH